ncbi:hypothetical protein HNP84_003563 [Thermocatellispora tengchongensis]|uniref:Uncharacterized protein n=1 Tax=Thermocatellispora tengchongensis TaxID=1073253 RepID=A0A840P9F8_9ACTN|nr:hypothetical protein [Thermocatellispora tengchongensis]
MIEVGGHVLRAHPGAQEVAGLAGVRMTVN